MCNKCASQVFIKIAPEQEKGGYWLNPLYIYSKLFFQSLLGCCCSHEAPETRGLWECSFLNITLFAKKQSSEPKKGGKKSTVSYKTWMHSKRGIFFCFSSTQHILSEAGDRNTKDDNRRKTWQALGQGNRTLSKHTHENGGMMNRQCLTFNTSGHVNHLQAFLHYLPLTVSLLHLPFLLALPVTLHLLHKLFLLTNNSLLNSPRQNHTEVVCL